MKEIIIRMSIMVLKASCLKIKLGLLVKSNVHSNHLQMIRCCPHAKEGQYNYSNQLALILDFFEKFCKFRQQYHTFYMDLHPQT